MPSAEGKLPVTGTVRLATGSVVAGLIVAEGLEKDGKKEASPHAPTPSKSRLINEKIPTPIQVRLRAGFDAGFGFGVNAVCVDTGFGGRATEGSIAEALTGDGEGSRIISACPVEPMPIARLKSIAISPVDW